MRYWVPVLAAATMLAAEQGSRAQQAVGYDMAAEGFDAPWSMAFLDEDTLLVTEKPGRLVRVDLAAGSRTVITGTPDVLYSGQGGLMDVELHPDFAGNGWIYLTWSAGTQRDNTMMLGRGRLTGDELTEFETIFTAEPHRSTDVHYGARILFLDDGSLLLSVGDGFDYREQAQLPQNHFGALVRLHEDGTPLDTEFEGGAPGVYTIGHRNPQALVSDPGTGAVYAHEHGPRGGDEINRIDAGANYGWPIASHGIDYSGALITPYASYPGMRDPLVDWTPSIAPSGMALYAGDVFADWQGDLLVTALIPGEAEVPSGHLRRIDLNDAGEVVDQHILLGDLGERLRDVQVSPAGHIYVLTDGPDASLIRLRAD